jgi:hypothetical protein
MQCPPCPVSIDRDCPFALRTPRRKGPLAISWADSDDAGGRARPLRPYAATLAPSSERLGTKEGGDEDLAIAALLHDSAEDQGGKAA